MNLSQSSGLGTQGLYDTGVCIYFIFVVKPYYNILCLLEGRLFGGRREVLKA
jgi:hypothetical protein